MPFHPSESVFEWKNATLSLRGALLTFCDLSCNKTEGSLRGTYTDLRNGEGLDISPFTRKVNDIRILALCEISIKKRCLLFYERRTKSTMPAPKK
jgi:hypothetical protein